LYTIYIYKIIPLPFSAENFQNSCILSSHTEPLNHLSNTLFSSSRLKTFNPATGKVQFNLVSFMIVVIIKVIIGESRFYSKRLAFPT